MAYVCCWGVARIFLKGGHTVSKCLPDCHVVFATVVGCLLIKGLHKGGLAHPRTLRSCVANITCALIGYSLVMPTGRLRACKNKAKSHILTSGNLRLERCVHARVLCMFDLLWWRSKGTVLTVDKICLPLPRMSTNFLSTKF